MAQKKTIGTYTEVCLTHERSVNAYNNVIC